MQARDGVFLEDLCPKLRDRSWRRSLHDLTDGRCLYCGAASESIDHIHPRSRGGDSSTENCVPACLACNGQKGDSEVFEWYREQDFYDPRRAMALRSWMDGDLRMAMKLLEWSGPAMAPPRRDRTASNRAAALGASLASRSDQATAPITGQQRRRQRQTAHQTRQAATPLWRWQIAS